MNRPLVYILSVVLFIYLIGMGLCHNRTCPDCITAKAALVPPVKEKTDLAITINDDGLNFTASTADNLLFPSGSCEFITPISDKLITVFNNTIQHLNENASRKLVLTGLYEGAETNDCTDQADLGIARAEKVKQFLVEMGAPSSRIELDASDIRDLQESNKMIVGGVDYDFMEVSVEEELRGENIILRFNTNKKEINLTDSQLVYFERLKAYLALNPDAKASVTGHTDDRGEDRNNIRLSRKRSEFVRDYMIDQGIAKNQISNKGMGPDVPVASNESEEGRAQNRRVEITLR